MWRKLFIWFGARVVVTTDHDDEMRWRFAFRDPRGGFRCRAISGWVRLRPDFTVKTPEHCYVSRWTPVGWNPKEEEK